MDSVARHDARRKLNPVKLQSREDLMAASFDFDVFLSHSSEDKTKAERIAKRLRDAGLDVWFDKWVIKPGDDILLEIEHGLEASRTMVLVISTASMTSDWVLLERSTTMFRDPANSNRRFIPVLIDDCLDLIPDTVKRFHTSTCVTRRRRSTTSL